MEAPYSPKEDLSDAREVNVLTELYDALDSRPRDIEIHEGVDRGIAIHW